MVSDAVRARFPGAPEHWLEAIAKRAMSGETTLPLVSGDPPRRAGPSDTREIAADRGSDAVMAPRLSAMSSEARDPAPVRRRKVLSFPQRPTPSSIDRPSFPDADAQRKGGETSNFAGADRRAGRPNASFPQRAEAPSRHFRFLSSRHGPPSPVEPVWKSGKVRASAPIPLASSSAAPDRSELRRDRPIAPAWQPPLAAPSALPGFVSERPQPRIAGEDPLWPDRAAPAPSRSPDFVRVTRARTIARFAEPADAAMSWPDLDGPDRPGARSDRAGWPSLPAAIAEAAAEAGADRDRLARLRADQDHA